MAQGGLCPGPECPCQVRRRTEPAAGVQRPPHAFQPLLRLCAAWLPLLLSERREHVSSRFFINCVAFSCSLSVSFFPLPACLTEFRLDKT